MTTKMSEKDKQLNINNPQLLTIKQLADLFQISHPCIRRWLRDNENVKTIKIGRQIRVPLEEVEKWIQDNKRSYARIQKKGR